MLGAETEALMEACLGNAYRTVRSKFFCSAPVRTCPHQSAHVRTTVRLGDDYGRSLQYRTVPLLLLLSRAVATTPVG